MEERSFLEQLVRAMLSGLLLIPACLLIVLMWVSALLRIRPAEKFFANILFVVGWIDYKLSREGRL
jgi:hypothetical protein